MADHPHDISHLPTSEQLRINLGNYTKDEMEKLSRKENPWPKPIPPSVESPPRYRGWDPATRRHLEPPVPRHLRDPDAHTPESADDSPPHPIGIHVQDAMSSATDQTQAKSARIQFILGLCIGLIPWGLSLIGITINLLLGCFILAATFVLIAHAFWIWERARQWPMSLRLLTIAVAFIFSAGFVGKQVITQYRQEHIAEMVPAPVIKPTPSPAPPPFKTLHDIFTSESLNFSNMDGVHTMTFKDNSKPLQVEFRVYFDLNARTRWIAYFVPNSPNTYDICKWFAAHYRETLAIMDQRILKETIPGVRPVDSKDLPFTGSIMLYHEKELFAKELDDLTTLYRKNGLTPQFRGPAYEYAVNHPDAPLGPAPSSSPFLVFTPSPSSSAKPSSERSKETERHRRQQKALRDLNLRDPP